jgi:hypothetical protein
MNFPDRFPNPYRTVGQAVRSELDEEAYIGMRFPQLLRILDGLDPFDKRFEQAARAGISFPAFCGWMVEDASCNR